MAEEGSEIRGVAQKMRSQVEKVNQAANKQSVQRAVYGSMKRTRQTGQKSVMFANRRRDAG